MKKMVEELNKAMASLGAIPLDDSKYHTYGWRMEIDNISIKVRAVTWEAANGENVKRYLLSFGWISGWKNELVDELFRTGEMGVTYTHIYFKSLSFVETIKKYI